MRHRYQFMLLALVLGAIAWPAQQVRAQAGDTLWVEWQDDNGDIIINALRNAIAGDTTEAGERIPNRVYGLYRSGLYYNDEIVAANNGYHLRIVGSTQVPEGQQDFGPPIIQMVVRSDGSAPGRLFTVQDDLTLKNVWITGQDDTGARTAYLPIFVEASDKRIVVDNCIMERTNFSIIGVGGAGNSVYITNTKFRNHDNTSQQWEGRGIRFEAGGDSLVMENNTFLNFGHTIVQSETAPVDYVRFNHNTIVNVGRTINSGGIWQSAYFTNNLVVNPYWHGEGSADYNTPNREDPYTGFFTVGELGSQFGTDEGREIVYANNAHWRDPAFEAYYADTIRAQPLFNSITEEFFELDNINASDNIWQDINPELVSYNTAPNLGSEYPDTEISLSELVPNMIRNIRDLREGEPTPFTSWLWDPGRQPDYYEGAGFVYPLPEDFTYTNEMLLTAGTDGLPLGDLNWFPSAKEDFESNKEEYIQDIEEMAQAPEVTHVGDIEVEDGSLAGGAEVVGYDYPVQIRLQEGPTITYTYDAPAAGTYTLTIHYLLDGGEKGQKIHINGEPYTEGDPDVMFSGDNNVWSTVDVDVELQEGENEIQIVKSWGWMYFGDIEIKQGDEVLETLDPIQAVLDGDVFFEQVNDDDPPPPSSWFSVSLPDAGSSVTLGYDADAAGTYSINVTYANATESAQQLGVLLNGTSIAGSPVSLEPTEGDWEVLSITDLSFTEGANQIEFQAVDGGVSLDAIDVFHVALGSSTEPKVLPEGYALDQNYPNPFNPTTTITFTLGKTDDVRLTVYDLLGRQVRTLVDGTMPAGTYDMQFDASSLASGVYFYRIETAVGQQVRKMILMK